MVTFLWWFALLDAFGLQVNWEFRKHGRNCTVSQTHTGKTSAINVMFCEVNGADHSMLGWHKILPADGSDPFAPQVWISGKSEMGKKNVMVADYVQQ